MTFPDPPWLAQIEDPEARKIAKVRFFLRLAAIYLSPCGDISSLSKAVGLHRNTLGSRYYPVSKRTAFCIQALLGSELFPSEMFLTSDAGSEAQ